ncbi:hypothetical protein B0H66DRAFT_516600 [Apodospora peruviana]|uniref:polynucleotide adenylyltransferase n=1 Tax=Apodospora peruviana TaxID=516989 RepID=A0AAE0I4S2_9PEZI|nr:hypothetical protein B0H66DRAFT_516600 [Apodospora peruviana]
MATLEASSARDSISVNSHDTALCIIPPTHLWPAIDRLRSLYDKAYTKWPPHINLVYPFVRHDVLPSAAESIHSIPLELDAAGVFAHKHENTLHLHEDDATRSSRLSGLRKHVLKALGQPANNYQMHMTVAQTEDVDSSAHKLLLDKLRLLPPVRWEVDQLHILVRERLQLEGGTATSRMKIWGTIRLSDGDISRPEKPLGFYDKQLSLADKDQLRTSSPYYFNDEYDLWLPYDGAGKDLEYPEPEDYLQVSSYNVLAEFEWPPSEARHKLLRDDIFANTALADVLVLQEVTDSFLSYLLHDGLVRECYPYVSHGPPDQPDVEPLPSLLNIVILANFAFDWEFVSFHRKHKGSVVAKFRDGVGGNVFTTVLASVHLTHGLADGAVAAKKVEIQMLLKYLSETYPQNPWIVAGDTNISTSSYTIDAALKKKSISASTAGYLKSFDQVFADAGLVDAWTVTRAETGDVSDYSFDAADYEDDEVFEGEQGATYDPIRNPLAAAVVGTGFNMRPQRFDRILVRGQGLLEIRDFNKFGFRRNQTSDLPDATYASDHWGVRCAMKIVSTEEEEKKHKYSEDVSFLVVPVHLTKAPASLSAPGSVNECLSSLGVLPSNEEVDKRKIAFDLLKKVLLENKSNTTGQQQVVIVPVGSYALDVWTSASDIDVLCIGPFSSNTFFSLATQRLKKAAVASQGSLRVLRRVNANSGLMLELEVLGINMDLQYCPAAGIAQRWPDVLSTPASDPVWSLSAQALSKLKAVRDADYLRRSIPDLASFRLAHRFIKTWAKSRGIYSAKFGFLGGIQISLLLARVHKLLLVRESRTAPSIPDLLTTFFNHYATFDWQRQLVFDPLFHKHGSKLPYTRSTTREPLAILGYYPPSLNTSQAASVPSTRTIAEEFKRASALLTTAESNTAMTWTSFLDGGSPASNTTATAAADISSKVGAATYFLSAYKSYVKIDVQYWGLSPSRGRQFVGWLESRCVMLLVDMNRRAPGVYARMWPARFVEQEQVTAGNDDEEARDYQGCYIIGLDKLDESLSKEELKVASGALQTALRRFEEQMRGDEKYFDARSCWMGASMVNRGSLPPSLTVDAREWGEYTPGDDADESDDDEDEEETEEEDYDVQEEEAAAKKAKRGKKKQRGKKEEKKALPILPPGQKFRTAADVINRIRWDPELDSSEYIVGYEDRFLGARERALDTWKSEQTDEEFIPQHRILYFKRMKRASKLEDGEIVWERKTRRDIIFGSGVAE